MHILLLVCVLGSGSCRTERIWPEITVTAEAVPSRVVSVEPAPKPGVQTLPAPVTAGSVSVEQALRLRRSQRDYAPTPLSLADLAQLAWAAQGVTDQAEGFRTAPSAGALYPLELYLVTHDGLWHYLPATHALEQRTAQDLRPALADAALGQNAVLRAPCTVVLTSVTARTRSKYGDRAERYVAMEAGHVSQNVLLQATARGLVGVPIGAFDEERVRDVLVLGPGEQPLYLIAIGHPVQPRHR